jgi:hypothetical protein
MKTEQGRWTATAGWQPAPPGELADAGLVMVFGSRALIGDPARVTEIRRAYPRACLVGCSTAGEILAVDVLDDSLVFTAVQFEHSEVAQARVDLAEVENSFAAGLELGRRLPREGLVHVFVLSDGIAVNGSDLVRGITEALPESVAVTGGMSADGDRFETTVVITGDGPVTGAVTALGFYGDRLRVGYGSLGGWDPFGPERLITRSDGNVLFELDGKFALDLYKRYLGEHASGLPATGLLFPLALRAPDESQALVRTILAVDEKARSLTFAGDVPAGWFARLMRANFDRLVEGASGAGRISHAAIGSTTPDLAILISCVGRKMVLRQRVEEEVEAVRNVLGEGAILTGFYSYGEISPFAPSARCELHNQTMTVTTLAER